MIVYGIRVAVQRREIVVSLSFVCILGRQNWPEIINGCFINHHHPARGAGFHRHIGDGHPAFHRHLVYDITTELEHCVGRALDADFRNQRKDKIFRENICRQIAVKINADDFLRWTNPKPSDNTGFQFRRADTCRKGAKRTMGASVAVTHNADLPRKYPSLFRNDRVANTVATDIKKLNTVLPTPLANNLPLNSRSRIFRRVDMIDHGLYLVRIKNNIHFPRLHIQYSVRRSDLMTPYPIQFQNHTAIR